MNKKTSLFKIFIGIIFLAACAPSTPIPVQSALTSTITADPSTPEPATATPTQPATPTLPPTPVPLFFTEEFNTDLGAWASFQTGGAASPAVNLENDLLRIDFATPNTWYYALHNAHEYSNISVSAKFFGTPTGSIGLICDYTEANGWYEFTLASDGTYSVLFGQWLKQEIAQYTPIAIDTTEYHVAGDLDQEIGLTCQENTLLLYINGKLFRKLDVTRFGLTQGKIGISASSFEETPATATFDWVKVSEPEQ